MQKFAKLVACINDREHELAAEIVEASLMRQKKTVILNACHEEVRAILDKALEILQEDLLPAEEEKPEKPKLRSIK
jgi:hypothetical protein